MRENNGAGVIYRDGPNNALPDHAANGHRLAMADGRSESVLNLFGDERDEILFESISEAMAKGIINARREARAELAEAHSRIAKLEGTVDTLMKLIGSGPAWQRGPQGEPGEMGPTGEKGERGECGPAGRDGRDGCDAAVWSAVKVDQSTFSIVPVMSDGTEGPRIPLASLFEQYDLQARGGG
jgi:hypothetical protein